MLLTFAAPGRGGRGRRLAGPGHGPAAARDRAAREPALLPRPARAAGGRGGAARPAGPGASARARRRDVAALLAGYAAGLEQDPWLTVWPALLTGTPVPPDGRRRGRAAGSLVDPAGAALPLAERESLWTLLAVSGGHPVTVAGEWHPDGLLPLAVWHGDRAVAL